MKKLIVYLDAGHGGLTPDGDYTTRPNKMFKHKEDGFHSGRMFYEGVFNRQVAGLLAALIEADERMEVVRIYDNVKDLSLERRMQLANYHYRSECVAEGNVGIGVSIHANASQLHRARGWEVYTSPGRTRADKLAELIYKEVDDLAPQFRFPMRPDVTDGDHDREARFYVLTKSAMAFVLTENLFFDQIDDARILMDEHFWNLLAEAHYRALVEYYSVLVGVLA